MYDEEAAKELMKIYEESLRKQNIAILEVNELNRLMHELIDKLSEADLYTFKSLVSQITTSVNPSSTANYWRAYAKGLLHAKFGVSPWHEMVSEEDFTNLLNDQNPKT